MTLMAILSLLDQFRENADQCFKDNPYIVIHDYRNSPDKINEIRSSLGWI